MYTIQIGEKFLRTKSWSSDKVDSASVSAFPQIVYSKAAADVLLKMSMDYLRRMVEKDTAEVKHFDDTIARMSAELVKVRATIATKEVLPYKQVQKEMGKLERRVLNLTQDIASHRNWKRYAERQLTRWNKLIAGNPLIVKLQKALDNTK
jgi:uncharacterized protein (DUF2132 family)